MIVPDIRQPEYDVQTVTLSKGLDMTSDPRRAHPESLSDCNNVQFDNDQMKYRQRFAVFSASESVFNSSHVRAIGSVLGTLWRVKGDQIQSYDWTNWNDRKTVDNNDLNCRFKSFFGRAASADVSSTTSGTSTSRTVTTTGLTANAHAGKIVRITSGAASGQSRMITANTDTTIYVADTFDTVPTTGATFEIYAKEACGYFEVSNSAYRFNYVHTSVPTIWAGAGWCLEVHKERLFGTSVWKVTFSCLGNGDSTKAEYQIPVGSGKYVPIIRSLGDSLRVYTPEWVWEIYGDGPDNFSLVKRSDRWVRTDSAYFEGAPENAVHDQFFISNDGVESSRRVEAMNYEPIPTSWPIFKSGAEIGAYAHLAQKDGRLYLFNNSSRNGSTESSAYVYDTQATSQQQKPVWSRIRFPRSVSCTYYDSGKLYLGIGWIVLVSTETGDDFTETTGEWTYSASVTTERLTQKDSERPKTYHKARCRVTVSGKGSINVSVGFEGSAPASVKTIPYDVGTVETEYDVVAFVSKTKKDITVKIESVPTTSADIGAFRVEEIQIYHKRKTKVK